MREHPEGYKLHTSAARVLTGATELHFAANTGDAGQVKQLLEEKGHLVNVRDKNGWAPLHVRENVRFFHVPFLPLRLVHMLKF